jgi:hypothetical protein
MGGPSAVIRTVVMGAIGFGIGWLVISDPALTHDSLPGIVLAGITVGSTFLAAFVAQQPIIEKAATRYAEGDTIIRFITEAAFGVCAALAWSLGLAVLLRS